jgi:hypothetical protein
VISGEAIPLVVLGKKDRVEHIWGDEQLAIGLKANVRPLAARTVDAQKRFGDVGDRRDTINHPCALLAVLRKHQGVRRGESLVRGPWSLVFGVQVLAEALASNTED